MHITGVGPPGHVTCRCSFIPPALCPLPLPQADVALYYTADVDYYSGKKASATPLGTFTIWRWALPGISGSVASTTPGSLVLPIDLSTTNCYQDGSGADVKCGDGKYVVRQVTAHRWVASDSTASDSNGIAPAATWSSFTIVGELLAGRGGLARVLGGELARPASTSILTRSMSAVAVPRRELQAGMPGSCSWLPRPL